NGSVCCILNQRGTAVGDKLVQIKHRLDPSLCMDCRVCPWRTMPCPVMGRPPKFLQPLAQGRNACLSVRIVRTEPYYGDAPHSLALLRARRERPRGRRAAEQRDKIAALHSITSSARASSVGGISRPSALAVLRLMTSSYLVGFCTGRSAG